MSKKIKANKTAHTSNSKLGMGDFYGSGIKNPIGRVREDMMMGKSMNSKDLGKAPKSLAQTQNILRINNLEYVSAL